MAYLSKVLKDVDTCDSADAVSEYLEGLEEMVTVKARKIERLVPSLRSKFRESAKSVYQSATSGQRYLDARSQQDWELSYKEFLVGCKGLSQESEDDVLQMILGNQFFSRGSRRGDDAGREFRNGCFALGGTEASKACAR